MTGHGPTITERRTYDSCQSAEEFTLGYSNHITPDVVARWEKHFRARSERVLATAAPRLTVNYGPEPRQVLDFFPAVAHARPTAKPPTLFAIHGGLWFLFDRWMMHFLVPSLTAAGINVACPSYRLAPAQGLGTIVSDCRAALQALHGAPFVAHVDGDRISVLGHSAAGQLAAVLAAESASAGHRLHQLIGVSGFFEIEPFALTEFQPLVRFSPADYRRWNPMNCLRAGMPAALLIMGAKESMWLHEMSQTYARELHAVGVPCELIDAAGECHFSVLDALGDPASPLHSKLVAALN